MNIEAALYNEHTLAWEPFIEPVLDRKGSYLLPWNITCSIKPVCLLKQNFIDIIESILL
jgi:hypothetical protein